LRGALHAYAWACGYARGHRAAVSGRVRGYSLLLHGRATPRVTSTPLAGRRIGRNCAARCMHKHGRVGTRVATELQSVVVSGVTACWSIDGPHRGSPRPHWQACGSAATARRAACMCVGVWVRAWPPSCSQWWRQGSRPAGPSTGHTEGHLDPTGRPAGRPRLRAALRAYAWVCGYARGHRAAVSGRVVGHGLVVHRRATPTTTSTPLAGRRVGRNCAARCMHMHGCVGTRVATELQSVVVSWVTAW